MATWGVKTKIVCKLGMSSSLWRYYVVECRERVRCRSRKGKKTTTCKVSVAAKRIKLLKQIGKKKCKKNKTYGIKSDHEIYVKKGCSGKFVVSCKDKSKKGTRI